MPGSPHSSSTARVGRPPGLFASMSVLKSGSTIFPAAPFSIIPVATYQARTAEPTNTQPATFTSPVLSPSIPTAASPAPAASTPRTAVTPRLPSASAPSIPENVIAQSAMNQKPTAWSSVPPVCSTPVTTSSCRSPYASQNEPHMPCIAVATESRARYAHMPARNCARPPKNAANGKRYPGVDALPYHPAMWAATMNVAPAKPNKPSTDGAAMGCKTTRGRAKSPYQPSVSALSATPVDARSCRSSIVLMVAWFPVEIPANISEYDLFIALSDAALRDQRGCREPPWPVARPPPVAGERPARARPVGAVAAAQGAEAAHRRRGARRPVDLPLLRGRLRAARLREGRRRDAHRGRPGEPHLARAPLPRGASIEELRAVAPPRIQGQVPPAVRQRLGRARPRDRNGHDRAADRRDARGQLAGDDRRGRTGEPHACDRQPRRRDARQRGELPDQEADDGPRRHPGREPSAHMTQLHGPPSGGLVRSRRCDGLPAGSPELRLHHHHGLEYGREPPGGFPVGDGGEGARGESHPHRPAIHPHERHGDEVARHPRRERHRLPRRDHQLHPPERPVLRGVRQALHECTRDHRRVVLRHRGARRSLLGLEARGEEVRHVDVVVRRDGDTRCCRPTRRGLHAEGPPVGARCAERRPLAR